MGGLPAKEEPELGDLIEIPRGGYQHWAVYVGDGYVVHVTRPSRGISKIMKEKLKKVDKTDKWTIKNQLDNKWEPRPPQEIVKEALSWEGQKVKYNLLGQNCEHFATWCRYGKEESRQVLIGAIAAAVLIPTTIFGMILAIVLGRRHHQREIQQAPSTKRTKERKNKAKVKVQITAVRDQAV